MVNLRNYFKKNSKSVSLTISVIRICHFSPSHLINLHEARDPRRLTTVLGKSTRPSAEGLLLSNFHARRFPQGDFPRLSSILSRYTTTNTILDTVRKHKNRQWLPMGGHWWSRERCTVNGPKKTLTFRQGNALFRNGRLSSPVRRAKSRAWNYANEKRGWSVSESRAFRD